MEISKATFTSRYSRISPGICIVSLRFRNRNGSISTSPPFFKIRSGAVTPERFAFQGEDCVLRRKP